VKVVKGLIDWGTCSCTVSFDQALYAVACWKNTITVSCSHDIVTLDASTGIHTSIISGHTAHITALAFSSDGVSLVSGDKCGVINLWDIQTGGIIKHFSHHAGGVCESFWGCFGVVSKRLWACLTKVGKAHWGHTGDVTSISISPDQTTIASGTTDAKIHLWHIQTGEHFCVIDGYNTISSISFFPTSSQLSISASYNNVTKQWDIGGYRVGPIHKGNCVAFSSDGTLFVYWGQQGTVATVQNSDSGAIVAKLQVPSSWFICCCFSPTTKFVAGGAGHNIYIWDITSSDPHLVKNLIGHTGDITSIAFSSSLISTSEDQSIKFWQIGTLTTDPGAADSESTTLIPASIMFITLQVNDGIAISVDSAGVVRVWDILTGLCKTSFCPPAQPSHMGDMQLIDNKLIFVQYPDMDICIWDIRKELLQTVCTLHSSQVTEPRISGDGSKVFSCSQESIQAWSTQTGEVVGEVWLGGNYLMTPLLWMVQESGSISKI